MARSRTLNHTTTTVQCANTILFLSSSDMSADDYILPQMFFRGWHHFTVSLKKTLSAHTFVYYADFWQSVTKENKFNSTPKKEIMLFTLTAHSLAT